jgi:hypothetical protein
MSGGGRGRGLSSSVVSTKVMAKLMWMMGDVRVVRHWL